jgi:hypothetical protein
MGRAPYGGDSLVGQTGGTTTSGNRGWLALMEQRTLFVLGSQYVLLVGVVLACFDPQWPNLKTLVAYFDFKNEQPTVVL